MIRPEGGFFRERLLPLIPEGREDQVIYYAPGHPKSPLIFNPLALDPGDDPVRAAEDLFTIFKRTVTQEEFGTRMQPIQNAFATLVGRPAHQYPARLPTGPPRGDPRKRQFHRGFPTRRQGRSGDAPGVFAAAIRAARRA